MDLFLKQDAAIVSSMVVAEKKFGAGSADNIVDTVLEIIGELVIKLLKQVFDVHVHLIQRIVDQVVD